MGTRANDIASLIRTGTQLDSDAIGTNAITAEKLNVGQLGGRRNLIINGAMQVAQRGTSETGITGTGYYTVDRFKSIISNQGTWTISQESVTDLPGFSNSLKMLCTTADASPAAGDAVYIRTSLEGQDLQHLKKGTSDAESVTLSFWVKSNKTGTYVVELLDLDSSPVRHINKSFTVVSSGAWEYKTLTFAGDTTGALDNDNDTGLSITFWLGSGTNWNSGTLQTSWGDQSNTDRAVGNVNLADATSNYFQITGVQLEVGETATPFEHRSFGEELALCQRYFQKSYDYGVAIGTDGTVDNDAYNGAVYSRLNDPVTVRMDAGTRFSTPLRATPTIYIYSIKGTVDKVSDLLTLTTHSADVGVSSLQHVGQTGIGGIILSTSTDDNIGYHYTADAEL